MGLNKDRLIKLIDRALNFEEEAVETTARNICSAVEFLEKDPKIKKEICSIMDTLRAESKGHAKIMHDLKDHISKEKKDVY